MNKPLSYITFFKGNKKTSTMYILTLVIAILILGITKIILSSSSNEMEVSIQRAEKLTEMQLLYTDDADSASMLASGEVIKKVRALDSVQSVLPAKRFVSTFRYFIGASESKNYFLRREDAIKLLDCLGVSYNENDLPNEGDNKAFISQRAAINAGLNLGDKILQNVDVTVDKTFISEFPISVIPTDIPDNSDSYIIIPKPDRLAEMNIDIQNIVNDNFELRDYKYNKNRIETMQKSAEDTFFIILIIVTFACSITTGITTYIHYYNRRKEIGIMKAIGYSDKRIVMRITKEVCISTISALLISLALIVVTICVLNVAIANTNGFVAFEFDYSVFLNIIVIPIFMGIFSLVPTWAMLRTMDKITLIQRGY